MAITDTQDTDADRRIFDTLKRPDYLYHFTSIEVLALILKYQKLRFRRLDFVDDPIEARTSDFGLQGKYILVSCWTNQADENLLQWSMYGKMFQGVRIRIRSDAPFDKPYEISAGDVPFGQLSEGTYFSSIEAHHLINDRYMIPPGDLFNHPCFEVKYTTDNERLVPKVISKDGTFGPDAFGYWQKDGPTVLLSEIGKYKNSVWKEQSEWRFMVPVFPMTREIFTKMSAKETCLEGAKLIFDAMEREQDPGLEYLDIPLKRSHIDQMEITLGPLTTAADRIIVESLCDSFAPKATIAESSLAGKVR